MVEVHASKLKEFTGVQEKGVDLSTQCQHGVRHALARQHVVQKYTRHLQGENAKIIVMSLNIQQNDGFMQNYGIL